MDTTLKRRDFISKSVLATGALVIGAANTAHSHPSGNKNENKSGITMSNSNLKTRKLGALEVSAIGLGCMNVVHAYGPALSRQSGVKLIRSAYDEGVAFFDTAEVYTAGSANNEEYVGEALKSIRKNVILATKCGIKKEGEKQTLDASRKHIREELESSLQRLQTDYVDLYYLHRLDPNTPIEDVANTMKELIKEGKIRYYGLSEVGSKTIRRAHAIHPVTAVQNEFALWTRDSEAKVIPACEELGIGFVPWSPLGQGYLSGNIWPGTKFGDDDLRRLLPRWTKEAMEANRPLIDMLAHVGKEKNATAAQVALAWILAQKPFIVPIPGTTKSAHLIENVDALNITLTPSDLEYISKEFAKVKIVGDRTAPALAARSDVKND